MMDWFKTKINQIKIERGLINCKFGPIKAVIIGAGKRGKIYSQYAKACPTDLVIVGVAEPREEDRVWLKNAFKIEEKFCFENWESLCKVDKFADCVIICTREQDHIAPAVECVKKGYHLLIERPIALNIDDCKTLYQTGIKSNVNLATCNVLRHHPSIRKLKESIDSGLIGDVVNVTVTAPLPYWQFAHEFVRGDLANQSRSAPMLLSYAYQDIDLICLWMSNFKCTKISSFGSLFHFRKENKPDKGGERCLGCDVETKCVFSAKKIYLNPAPESPRYPMGDVCDIEDSDEGYLFQLKKAVETGPYGKCVYDLDNDVCDDQVVSFQFSNGATASLTVAVSSKEICSREVVIYGTSGQLKWKQLDEYSIEHSDFLTDTTNTINCDHINPDWGSNGSDFLIIKAFVDVLLCKKDTLCSASPDECLNSHLLTFAAEHSRVSGAVVVLEDDSTWRI